MIHTAFGTMLYVISKCRSVSQPLKLNQNILQRERRVRSQETKFNRRTVMEERNARVEYASICSSSVIVVIDSSRTTSEQQFVESSWMSREVKNKVIEAEPGDTMG